MAERALAHIEEVAWVKPIDGANNIELIGILGWVCIAQIGEFEAGDKAVYIEIDSRVPSTDERFEFLAKKNYKVKTMKLGKFKVVSQGLALPISKFPEIANKEIGTDVTADLHIVYSVEEDNVRKAKADPDAKYKSMAARNSELFKKPLFRWLMRREWGKKLLFAFFGNKNCDNTGFPTKFEFVHKTDENRIENMPWLLANKHPLTVTEKLDGTSSTYILERLKRGKYEFYVTSRNVRQFTVDNIYYANAIKYDIENHLLDYLNEHKEFDYVCLQGESVGHVQGNPLKLDEDDLYIFNFITSDGRMDSKDAKPIIESWGMKWVPVLATDFVMPDEMEEFKLMADGNSVVNPKVLREGMVLRDYTTGLSFKNVSRKYLLKKGE